MDEKWYVDRYCKLINLQMEESLERLSLLLFGCSLILIVYIETTKPGTIPIFRHLGIDFSVERPFSGNARDNVMQNYQEDVAFWADDYDLSTEYLLSLIILECGGQKPCGKRFEPKRYRQLKNLRDGKRRKFENLLREDLVGLSDTEIQGLATSWGPFQIMGYHSIGLSKSGETVTINDFTGPRAVEIGVRWVAENYGRILRHERYKDAFHMHNTGRVYPKVGKPKTHDPDYVSNGLSHMAFFTSHLEVDETANDSPAVLSTPDPTSETPIKQNDIIDRSVN